MSAHPVSLFDAEGVTTRLIFTPCPGTRQVSLDEALTTLKEAGATAVITAMPDTELAENQVTDMGPRCAHHGLDWFHLPVADDSAPVDDFERVWAAQQDAIQTRLQAGERIAIHCKGGSGRTGLIAAVLLTSMGLSLVRAKAQVQALRPKALQHPVHAAWISDFAARLGGPSS